MGWSLRKSLRVLPGILLNLSKSGPRLSVGLPGARASIDTRGKARLYAGRGPLRFQKSVTIARQNVATAKTSCGLFGVLKRILG